MAGTIAADTLTHSTAGSLTTDYVVNGSAKAWVNFNGTGTVSIRDSLNLSSISDMGTGDFKINISNAFGNANYNISSSASIDAANLAAIRKLGIYAGAGSTGGSVPTTTVCRVASIYSNENRQDCTYSEATFQGDLA